MARLGWPSLGTCADAACELLCCRESLTKRASPLPPRASYVPVGPQIHLDQRKADVQYATGEVRGARCACRARRACGVACPGASRAASLARTQHVRLRLTFFLPANLAAPAVPLHVRPLCCSLSSWISMRSSGTDTAPCSSRREDAPRGARLAGARRRASRRLTLDSACRRPGRHSFVLTHSTPLACAHAAHAPRFDHTARGGLLDRACRPDRPLLTPRLLPLLDSCCTPQRSPVPVRLRLPPRSLGSCIAPLPPLLAPLVHVSCWPLRPPRYHSFLSLQSLPC